MTVKEQGAELLVLPEYACEQWLSFAPPGLPPTGEIAWMAEQAPYAREIAAELAIRHGMAILPGSMPVRDPQAAHGEVPFVNRAWLCLPDGSVFHQDKLCLTPGEQDPDDWQLSPARRLTLIHWRGLRLVILICLDCELPDLAAHVSALQPDLILVPSQTSRPSGYHRVFHCARARAVESMTAVAAVGVIGAAATGRPREGYHAGAALFLPCESALGSDGNGGFLPALDSCDDEGPVLSVDIPIERLRTLRRGGAEVWPGPWSARHIELSEETEPF
ncbi:nitrilase-related carbon-nitrogen hydrolase [Fodinicurvata halophila]|uniref:nitrilase-related carbon-nitrogen hydrolase n=1 Tax=Fodinicurvata halophila TaxID=1419723 RepID=UPI00362F5173